MMNYNYREAMIADILEYIRENYTAEEIEERAASSAEWEEELHDILWNEDSVTGNGSGSYWFSNYKAEEALCHNWDLLAEALSGFGCDVKCIANGAEWCDVTIRCYLLGECIFAAVDTL